MGVDNFSKMSQNIFNLGNHYPKLLGDPLILIRVMYYSFLSELADMTARYSFFSVGFCGLSRVTDILSRDTKVQIKQCCGLLVVFA